MQYPPVVNNVNLNFSGTGKFRVGSLPVTRGGDMSTCANALLEKLKYYFVNLDFLDRIFKPRNNVLKESLISNVGMSIDFRYSLTIIRTTLNFDNCLSV